jgi:hypothetical protein
MNMEWQRLQQINSLNKTKTIALKTFQKVCFIIIDKYLWDNQKFF